MRARFWGVRGSLPTPLSPSSLKRKISAIVERAATADLSTPSSRERFLASLPPWLFGTVGGNTPCLELRTASGDVLLFDAGSGIREFGVASFQERPRPLHFHLFLSHFHWDHIQGLPFFGPAYDPSVRLDFYNPTEGFEGFLSAQMSRPQFPVEMASMGSQKNFNVLEKPVTIGSAFVSFRRMNHPGGSYAYCVEEAGRRFIYATDTELSPDDFQLSDENKGFFEGADVLVLDAQYTLGEAIEKFNWGHSSFSLATDFASTWGVKKLVLFHHEPSYDDAKLYRMLQAARHYADRLKGRGVEVTVAVEGMELEL